MKVAILGYSTLEQSESVDAYNYYRGRGDDITIYYWGGGTLASDLPEDAESRLTPDEHTFVGLDEFDLIVRGAFVHPKDIKTSKPVTSVNNEFLDHCPATVIGVTGTKGKGTTSTLIAKMLEAAGKKVLLVGNIGRPPLALLPQITKDDFVVYELSSFQLMDIKKSPHIGVCVMVVPEHLNWHADMEEYMTAKANLFRYQSPDDLAVCDALNENSCRIASASPATKLGYAVPEDGKPQASGLGAYVDGDTIMFKGSPVCKTTSVVLLGRHNLENVCAAITAVWDLINGNIEAITSVVSSFRGLEHRLEFVRELKGVSYYDDSFSTTPETAIAAMKSFHNPVVMILGGSDKGIPFNELAREVAKAKPRKVLAIGKTGPVIAKLLQTEGYNNIILDGLNSMSEIVKTAQAEAEGGDTVLLSTGCASFGMFKDYKDRGNQFKAAVQALV
jgi:UDP-N-acetylmuramoylalanine--D-glutamate ligase